MMITLINLYIALAFIPRALKTGFGIESVTFRLASLNSLYQNGLSADIFIVPCLKLFLANENIVEAYDLLFEYSENFSQNPNTHKYIHEFLAKLQPSEIQDIIDKNDFKTTSDDCVKLDLLEPDSLLQSSSLTLKCKDLLLYHKLLYSLKVLPEPCPRDNAHDAYSCPTNVHLPVVRQLITQSEFSLK
ncbi:hypothetical protein Ciccas_006781 [Cichlidogyrus casuarinus]|uniref:Uncharacterized protein n=1 Tax=Cichlidogyrus casuarinus TaxID=1844966 RepID=A0ABD2Q4R6_9PLAT